jgi:hypothetical protein
LQPPPPPQVHSTGGQPQSKRRAPTPRPHPLSQRDGGDLYMTLHIHRVDDRTVVEDGEQPLDMPADSIRICGALPWQSGSLVFANGDAYGTAACNIPSFTGDHSFCCSVVDKFTKIYKIPISAKTKIREKMGQRPTCKGRTGSENDV